MDLGVLSLHGSQSMSCSAELQCLKRSWRHANLPGCSSHQPSGSFCLGRPSRSQHSRLHHLRMPAQRLQVAASSAESADEPLWKQKLAAADSLAEKSRQATLQAQEEYRRRQRSEAAQAASGTGSAANPLASIDFVSYLDEEGKIVDVNTPDGKAYVYAIFDEHKALQYIGISRQLYQSMRLHFARVPDRCWFVKSLSVSRPSRMLLESVRDSWIAENGGPPPGNDEGPEQNRWENPVDCKPLMTSEEVELFEEAAPGPPKAKVLKNVARRIEKDLMACFQARNNSDGFRFDPKLKDKGLLDLKSVVPDASVPKTTVPTK